MLANIMTTELDTGPLVECSASSDCVDLIAKMLEPDPMLRPNEQQCFSHPWLVDFSSFGEIDLDDNNVDPEEDEQGDEPGPKGGQADSDGTHDSDMSEVEVDEIDHEPTRYSKRAKVNTAFAFRGQTQLASSMASVSYPLLPRITTQQSNVFPAEVPQQKGRLFGEIGSSALRSSGVLDYDDQAALEFTTQGSRDTDTSVSVSTHLQFTSSTDHTQSTNDDLGNHHLQYPRALPLPVTEVGADPSLFGTESLVGKLNMGSPESGKSAYSAPNTPRTPTTPKTREATPTSSIAGSKRTSRYDLDQERQSRPKRRKSDDVRFRKLSCDPPPSYYFENDRKTHNLEYASKVSGRDYVAEAKTAFAVMEAKANGEETAEIPLLPDGVKPWTTYEGWEKEPYVVRMFGGELDPTRTDTLAMECRAAMKLKSGKKTEEFIKPLPRLGKLTSVPGSFVDLTLKLDRRVNKWGRAPENTIVYTQNLDTRVPKNAIDIMFWGPSIPALVEAGGDWMTVTECWAIIVTRSSTYITVNGVPLKYLNSKKDAAQYGKLYTGDIVTVYDDGKEYLKFKCEFFHSKSVGSRPANETPFVICKEKPAYMKLLSESRSRAASAAASASASAAVAATATASSAVAATAGPSAVATWKPSSVTSKPSAATSSLAAVSKSKPSKKT